MTTAASEWLSTDHEEPWAFSTTDKAEANEMKAELAERNMMHLFHRRPDKRGIYQYIFHSLEIDCAYCKELGW